MNEIKLSDSLPVIETEIRQFQNLAGESIFEIGRRLKHVKENGLAHGEFGKWLESVNISKDYSAKYIKVYDEFKNSNIATSRNLSISVLHELTQLPEPERTKEHTTSKGETKTPDEMTVKELRELKKQLKQRDELIASREQENEILQSKLEDAENKEPKIIERYSEPDDYQEIKNNLKYMNQMLDGKEEYVKKLQQEIADMRAKRSDMDKKSKEYDELNVAINEMNGRLSDGQLRLKNQKAVYDLIKDSKKLVSDVAPLVYAIEWLDLEDNDYAQKPLKEIARNLSDIAQKINKKLEEKEIIEVN